MTDLTRRRRIEEVCDAALECKLSERAAFVTNACGDDETLRQDVEALLAHAQTAEGFLATSISAVAADILGANPRASLVGRQIGSYEILAHLGAGGMGEVYRARDTRLGRDVAVKTLPVDLSRPENHGARFYQEARAIASLNHPHICVLHDVGQHDGFNYLVMEYLEGPTLKQRLLENAPLPLDEVVRIASEIADALAEAHRHGIVHRDVKPGNITLTKTGAKLLDFGLARAFEQVDAHSTETPTARSMVLGIAKTSEQRLTVRGALIGTIAYMSPEQARGLDLDGRSDLFSLGIALYEMVTRTHPFEGERPAAVFEAILDRTPTPAVRLNPDVSPELEQIVSRLLQKDRDLRYQTAADVHADLTRVQREGLSGGLQVDVASALSTTAPPVTERDAILLADFANTTGEPIFDGTLKQALAVKLEESPYLNIVSDDRIQQTLRLMGRRPDECLTPALSREICERQGTKAMVIGSIANLGSQYVVMLTAINCQNGDSIARAQAEAASKEEVLKALGAATTRFRGKLGESLASIQRFDVPLEEATTSSLDALKAYSLACSLRNAGKAREAIPQLNHAINLDPNFALAHAALGITYSNLREPALADQYVTQAYERRRRITERERLLITVFYHRMVTGDLLKRFEVSTLLRQTYPRYSAAYNQLGLYYGVLGQFTHAADAFSEAARLAPEFSVNLGNVASSYIEMNRLDEAKTVLQRATALEGQSTTIRQSLAHVAYLQRDDAAQQRELEWLSEHDPSRAFAFQAFVASMAGRLRDARECVAKSADLEARAGMVERAALTWLWLAQTEAAVGVVEATRQDVAIALTLASSRDVAHRAARILAMCGFQKEAQPLLDHCVKEYPPTHTLAKALYIPTIRAAFALTQANAAAAIEALQPAGPYDARDYCVPYLRASAYLAADRPSDAAAEFQQVIDRAHGRSAFAPIAQLGRARALARMGDVGGSRTPYRDFLAVWQNADPDLPILMAAKREYARLR